MYCSVDKNQGGGTNSAQMKNVKEGERKGKIL